jgi:lipopolysaccharide transport system ATP-binding protein
MSDAAISAHDLSKEYRLGQLTAGYSTLREDLVRAAGAVVGRRRPRTRRDSIWALRNVSFDLGQGEVIGLIGRNGAGKSTLLRILSRITEPTSGYADVRGRVGSLLEVGTGFHPELTGRENVFLNGATLGMSRKEIARKFDEIVEFAGVSRFIDTPVKRYSTGMYVRLAFAVAAHLEPEILLVDEVLAVGDAEFQRKCLGKLEDVTQQGRTIVFVSHNMSAIRGLCKRALFIDRGEIVFDGPTEQTVAKYLQQAVANDAVVGGEELERRMQGLVRRDDPLIRCREIALLDESGRPTREFKSDREIQLSVVFECLQEVTELQLVVQVTDSDNLVLLRTEKADHPSSLDHHVLGRGVYRAVCTFPADTFGERRFYLSVYLAVLHTEHLDFRQILSFDVEFVGYNNNFSVHSKQAYFRPALEWTLERDPAGVQARPAEARIT